MRYDRTVTYSQEALLGRIRSGSYASPALGNELAVS